MRITLQPAFILHSRPYRETSLLLDLFTREHGRITLIAKGIRKNRSPLKALLQPFTPILVSWQGKSELMTLTTVESQGIPFQLRGDCLLSGFYLNELLVRMLQKHDPYPHLYTVYHQTLVELQARELQQKTLRLFEKTLLEEIGYGIQLTHEIASNIPIEPEQKYRYFPEQGFKRHEPTDRVESTAVIFSGKSLLAFAQEELDDPEYLRDAKRLIRLVMTPLLGAQPLHSRKLFVEV